jgi:hypothetical protein
VRDQPAQRVSPQPRGSIDAPAADHTSHTLTVNPPGTVNHIETEPSGQANRAPHGFKGVRGRCGGTSVDDEMHRCQVRFGYSRGVLNGHAIQFAHQDVADAKATAVV